MNTIRKIWIYSLFVKIILAILLPLSQDEAYYWVWSHNLQLSYFDHPAMVAWLFWLGHFLEPLGNAVRLPAVLLGHCTLLIWILILKNYFNLEKARSWLWLALVSPLIGFGSLIVTPDLPLVFFWSLSIFFFLRALEYRTWKDHLFLGASLGAGFCSKYHIVLFVPIVLIYLCFEKKWSRLSFSKVFGVILAGFVFSLPVLLWNYQNDFASFKFQLAHGLQRPRYQFDWTWTYVAGQILLLFPLVFWKALRAKIQGLPRFIIYVAWGPLLFFLCTSFKALVEANWPIAAYPGVFLLAVAGVDHRQIMRRTNIGWLIIYLVLLGSLLIPKLDFNAKLREPFRFNPLIPLITEYSPLYASTYQMASVLWYQSKKPVYKLRQMNRFDFYDTLENSKPVQNLFYLVAWSDDTLPAWIAKEGWSVKEIKKIDSDFVLIEIKKP